MPLACRLQSRTGPSVRPVVRNGIPLHSSASLPPCRMDMHTQIVPVERLTRHPSRIPHTQFPTHDDRGAALFIAEIESAGAISTGSESSQKAKMRRSMRKEFAAARKSNSSPH